MGDERFPGFAYTFELREGLDRKPNDVNCFYIIALKIMNKLFKNKAKTNDGKK